MQEQHDKIATPSKAPKMGWRLVCGGILLLIIVILVSTSLWNLKFNKYRQHDIHYGVTITDKATERRAGKARNDAIARVKILRDVWQTWAWQNRGLLMRMRSAAPYDEKTLQSVYDALPLDPGGGNMGVLGAPSTAALSAGGLGFTWQPLAKLSTTKGIAKVYPDPQDQTKHKKIVDFMAEERKKNFAKYRDIELSKSLSLGSAKLTLWVSGRVTEQSLARQYTPGKGAWIEGPVKDILPPYGFLNKTIAN